MIDQRLRTARATPAPSLHRALFMAGVVCLHLAAMACRGPSSHEPHDPTPATVGTGPHPAASPQDPRPSATEIAGLRQLVVADQQAVERAAQHVAGLRELAKAGRSSSPEVLAAELELLRQRQTLRLREWQLVDAQHGAARPDPCAHDSWGAAAAGADTLAALVAMDRQAVELAEQSLAQQRSLAQAGKVTTTHTVVHSGARFHIGFQITPVKSASLGASIIMRSQGRSHFLA